MGMESQETFGQWLKQRRKQLGLTQADLAKALNCSTINIRKIEADERKPSRQVASLLAEFLRIPSKDQDAFVSFTRSEPGLDQVEAASVTFHLQDALPWSPVTSSSTPPRFPDPPLTLPASRTSFIGREQELIRLQHLMIEQNARLITLTGAPGVGKTRLVLEAGARLMNEFSGGAGFIPLASIRTPNEVDWVIAQRLGVSGSGKKNHLDNLVTFLRMRSFLLILDNFEHVLNAAPLVAELLKTCPNLKVLATSREPLQLYGEHEFQVTPLALPDFKGVAFSSGNPAEALLHFPSVQLFVQRCQAILLDFQITTENAEAVANICFRLDGLPLAIELAAARIKMYSPKSILSQLKNRFHFLSNGMRDFDIRHQTLEAAIDWSYQLLSPQEKLLLERLGVFRGYFTVDSARAVCFFSETSSEDFVASLQLDEDVLISLVEKSLVQMTNRDGGEEARFFLLETIREYGFARLQEHGEKDLLQSRHADFFFRLVAEAKPMMHGPLVATWMDRLDAEYGNIRAALGWAFNKGDARSGCKAAAELLFYWYRRSTFSEAQLWLETALERLDPSDRSAVRASLLESAGALGYFLPETSVSMKRLGESITLWKEQNNLHGVASASFWRYAFWGRVEKGHSYIQESIRLFRELGDDWWLAMALWLYGVYSLQAGEKSAEQSLLESEALFRKVGDPYGISLALQSLGMADSISGDLGSARKRFFTALKLKQSIGDLWSIAQVVKDIGDLELIEAVTCEDFVQAETWFEKSLEMHLRQGTGHVEHIYTLHRLGITTAAQANPRKAMDLYRECLALCIEHMTSSEWVASFLIGPAQLAIARGDPIRAAKLLGAMTALNPNFPIRTDRVGAKLFEQLRSAALACLGESVFEDAWISGQRMTIQEAISLASTDLPGLEPEV